MAKYTTETPRGRIRISITKRTYTEPGLNKEVVVYRARVRHLRRHYDVGGGSERDAYKLLVSSFMDKGLSQVQEQVQK